MVRITPAGRVGASRLKRSTSKRWCCERELKGRGGAATVNCAGVGSSTAAAAEGRRRTATDGRTTAAACKRFGQAGRGAGASGCGRKGGGAPA
jgi:hypothetical protein